MGRVVLLEYGRSTNEGQVVLLGYGRSNRAGWCCSGCTEGSPLKGGTLEKETGVSVIRGE